MDQRLDAFDFLQVDTVDLDGTCRSKILSKSFMKRAWDHGLSMDCAVQAMGYHTEHPEFEDFPSRAFEKGLLKLDKSTLIHKAWATDKWKLGHALAEMHWFDENGENLQPHPADPRAIARQVLQELHNEGFSLYSAFEYEFQLLNSSALQPFAVVSEVLPPISLHQNVMEMMMSMVGHLQACGVDCTCLHREYGPGQVEMPLAPEFGLKAADNAIRFKSAVKEIALQNNHVATFMSKPFVGDACIGAHFNLSLWNAEGSRNVLFDAAEPHKLSETGKHWLAGIVHHLPAMTALLCPTSNCYRRLGNYGLPQVASWGVESRLTGIRVKNHSEQSCYLENRLSSGPVNPYLALAGNVIAGLDGIRRKLSLPAEKDAVAPLPRTLSDALDALEADAVLMEKLNLAGKWFLQLKRKTDLKIFGQHQLTEDRDEVLALERDYFLLVV